MFNFSPRTRVTFGLISLLSSAMMLAMVLHIVPDRREAVLQGRARLCEAIAVNSSVLVNRKDINRLQAILTVLVARHEDIESAGIRHGEGQLLVEIGEHAKNWHLNAGDISDDAQIYVPIMDGKTKWGGLEVRFTPLHGGMLFEVINNPWVRLIAFVSTITAIGTWFYLGKVLEQLNPSHAVPGRVRSALDTLAEGLLVLDRKGRIVLCNQALADTLGEDAQKLIAKSARNLPWQRPNVDDESSDEIPLPWERTLQGDTRHTVGEPLMLIDTHGNKRIFQTNCSPVLGGETEVRGVVCSFEDITELEAQKSQLAESRAEAEAANEAKSAFLANMSHEIRTPMNAILGFTEVLRRDMYETPEQRTEYLETIHRSGQHLLHLINDILDLSKVEAGHLELECIPCSPHQLLLDVSTVLQVKANEKGLKLECSTPGGLPEIINSDPARLRQIITNLIGNAIKFTSDGGVSIRAYLLRGKPGSEENVQMQIDIVDTGVGISEAAQKKIFEPFTQADGSITRRFGGTGLGLTISKKFAEALGGGLSVSSVEGKGSTFSVVISIGEIAPDIKTVDIKELEERNRKSQKAAGSKARYEFGPSRVLLVDDGEANRQLIQLVLQRAGLLVETAVNGQEAVDKARAAEYDVILMDMQMPVMDGYTATRTLRSDGMDLPIIALTANAMRGDEEKCLDAGCSHFLSKPVDLDKLQSLLAELLDADVMSESIQTATVVNQSPAPSTPAISFMDDAASDAGKCLSDAMVGVVSEATLPPTTESPLSEPVRSIDQVSPIAEPPYERLESGMTDPDGDHPDSSQPESGDEPTYHQTIHKHARPIDQNAKSSVAALPSEDLESLMKSIHRQVPPIDHEQLEPDDEGPIGNDSAGSLQDSCSTGGSPIVSTLPMDDEEFREIVIGFVGKLNEEVDKIIAAWNARDLEEIAKLAHWLKGAAGTVGFREFTEPGVELMNAARENRIDDMGPLVEQIAEMTTRVEVPTMTPA